MTKVGDVRYITLLSSLAGESREPWIKIPLAAAQDVGAASQTLGGLLRLEGNETFASIATIAPYTRLPAATVKKHLWMLNKHGWIENCGRQRTRAGFPRRTATLRLTRKTASMLTPYVILPWWASCHLAPHGKLPWSAKIVLGVLLSRLAGLLKVLELSPDSPSDPDDIEGGIENMGGEDNFRFSLESLHSHTGLWFESIVSAKAKLHQIGVVKWQANTAENGGDLTDVLAPNFEFQIRVTELANNMCRMEVVHVKK